MSVFLVTYKLRKSFFTDSILFSGKCFNNGFIYSQLFVLNARSSSTFLCSSSQRMCSMKKVSLKFQQNLQENTCVKVAFWIKLQSVGLHHRCFPKNFGKFLKTSFWKTTFRWLFLPVEPLIIISNTRLYNLIMTPCM